MKTSDRQSFGGNVRLTYRNSEKKLNISNNVSVMVTNGHNGGFVQTGFSNFIDANPYYKMINDDGTIPKYLDEIYVTGGGGAAGSTQTAANPYYNANLNSFSDSHSTSIVNNTNINWYPTDGLQWQASLSLNSSKSDGESFSDPRDTKYKSNDYTTQGSYSKSNISSWRYSVNTSLNYVKVINDAHSFTLFGRGSADETNNRSDGYTVVGFPEGIEAIPSYAYGYPEGSRPTYYQNTKRLISGVLGFYYNYKYRYNFDFNYNIDGSSTFGSNKQTQSFWNVGAAWNVHKEKFGEALKDSWLQELKFRASYGINGTQSIDAISENIYQYFTGSDPFGMASYLAGFANPDLEWQIIKKFTAGVDLTMLNKRLTGRFDVFKSKTDPLVIGLAQKLSSGLSSYAINAGYMNNNGYEFSLAYYLIRDTKNRISLKARVTGMHYKRTYGGFDDRLSSLNDAYKNQTDADGNAIGANVNINSLIKYQDGYSPNTLWAVRSLGIDPATGNEIFLTKDGTPTFAYNADDRVAVGDRTPDLEGVISLDFIYKKLSISAFFRYRYGAEEFNNALYNKVENITTGNLIYNQDKRALYDRWYQPGDVSQFKNVNVSKTTNTPVSSRFIQKDNEFKGESFRLSWDFSEENWIKKFALRSFRFTVSMNDLFKIRSMKEEKGTSYPFQRQISFGISAGF